jgi:hypothetical protein
MGLVRCSGTLIPTPLFGVGWLAMPLDRLGDGFSGPVCFWPDFPRSVSPLPVRSVRFPAHSRIAGVSMAMAGKYKEPIINAKIRGIQVWKIKLLKLNLYIKELDNQNELITVINYSVAWYSLTMKFMMLSGLVSRPR